jgi:threonine dehydrogenase-like Zn-dependent dehydrogenase
LVAPRTLKRRNRRLAELDERWVRVRYLYCGICGSDLSHFEGRRKVKYPLSLGHEFVAEVRETGAEVRGLAQGDIVTSDLNYRCGSCDQCRAHRSHLCRIGQSALFSKRAFAELGDLHESYLTRLDGRFRKQLALSEPLSCVMHARDWAGPRPDDRVLIIGAGGLACCLAFALATARPAVAFDITDKLHSRAALIAEVTPVAHKIDEPQGEYDIVFDLSGTESGLRSACTHTKPGGKLCTMSHLDGYSRASFLLAALTRRDVTFTVSYLNGERDTLATAARALAKTWSPAWDRLLETVPVAGLQEAFAARRSSPRCKTLVEVAPADN